MKLGSTFCVSGICLIGVALALAWFCVDARGVVSPSELDGICGGQCGIECSEDTTPGCAQEYESGDCEMQYLPGVGDYCPDETYWESCNQDERTCTSGSKSWCQVTTGVTCPGWVWKYQCEHDNAQPPDEPGCYWRAIYDYPCGSREPGTYDKCSDG